MKYFTIILLELCPPSFVVVLILEKGMKLKINVRFNALKKMNSESELAGKIILHDCKMSQNEWKN